LGQDRLPHERARERQRQAHLKVTAGTLKLGGGHAADIVGTVMHGPASPARPARPARHQVWLGAGVGQLLAAVPGGSYLALSQVASDIQAEQMAEAAKRYNRLARETQRHRSRAEVARFFDGLDLVDPGLVPVQQWRPASDLEARARSAMWGGVARKP